MKNKFLIGRIISISILIFIIFLYFILYFFPSLKSINKYKREIKDLNLRITDFIKMETKFVFSDNREKQVFKDLDQELKEIIPVVKSREDYLNLFMEVSKEIKNWAKIDNVYNLIITSSSDELEVSASSVSSDKKTITELLNFTTTRLHQIKTAQEINNQGINPDPTSNIGPTTPGPQLKFQKVFLTFTGELPNSVSFINHIPWSSRYIRPDKISVTEGEYTPYFLVYIKIYYSDLRKGNE